MHIRNTLLGAAAALAMPLTFGAASADAADLLETLKDSDQFSKFVEAIEAAELEETFEGDGPYTVFAPTDDAFDELPEGVAEALLEDDNKDTLEKLLKAHVVEGEELASSDIEDEDEQRAKFEPMEGDELTIDASGDDVRVSFAGSDDEDSDQQAMVVGPASGAAGTTGTTGATGTAGTTGATGTTGGTAGTGTAGTTPPPATGTTGGTAGMGAGGTAGTGAGGQSMAEGSGAMTPPPATGTTGGTTGATGTGAPSTAVVTTTPGQEDDGEDIGAREATVVEADIEADNGVIHAIDAVLVPEDLREDLRELKKDEG